MTDDAHLPEHVRRNRAFWDAEAAHYVAGGERAWARAEPSWGIWQVPESRVGLLPPDLAGKDVIELEPYRYVTLEWARKWPTEEIWKARRR